MTPSGVEIKGPDVARGDEILTDEALELLAALHREINGRRKELLAKRLEVQADLDAGGTLDFLEDTKEIRDGDWQVSPAPPALRKRWVEITGPTSAKMVINALNSGSTGFMADFEDANSPSWSNMVGGQVNLMDAVRGRLEFDDEAKGKQYRLNDETATLLVRPRGWHLEERHLTVDGEPVAGGLMDFALYIQANARDLIKQGSGPYFYLPKMESHLEARMWNDAMTLAEEQMGLDHGTARGTVLIETLPAAFQMDEILYELRDHSGGLNAGRWDYIFSAIKRFKERPEFVTPDRVDVTMTVPFMHAYSELLVKTCHKRGAHAMGGMSAVIPSRTDEEAAQKALDAVASDKRREAGAGFDGSWVAHPDSVEPAMGEFEKVLGSSDNQVDKQRDDVDVAAADILAIDKTEGQITEKGLRLNVNVGIQYISSWLRGNGAAAIYGLMEDAATAEISRGQIWQWIRHGATLDDGRTVTPELVRELAGEELETIRKEIGDDEWFEREGRPEESRAIFEAVALSGNDSFVEFLTLPAYDKLEEIENAAKG